MFTTKMNKTAKGQNSKVDDGQAEQARDSMDDSSMDISSDDDRIIYFTGEVTELSVSQAIAALFAMSKRDMQKPIYLIIETYGGSVDSMFSLYDAIKFVPCPIYTIAMGKVMSAGVLILAAGQKGNRLIAPHARVMTHPSWTNLMGNIFDIKHELKEFERQEEQWINAMEIETGMPKQFLNELNDRRGDQYLTPQECIDWGIADKLLYDSPFRNTGAVKAPPKLEKLQKSKDAISPNKKAAKSPRAPARPKAAIKKK